MAWRCNADPGTLEDFDAFKGRVRNAVAWLNGNAKKKEEMTEAVDSMQRRLQELIRLQGARAGLPTVAVRPARDPHRRGITTAP